MIYLFSSPDTQWNNINFCNIYIIHVMNTHTLFNENRYGRRAEWSLEQTDAQKCLHYGEMLFRRGGMASIEPVGSVFHLWESGSVELYIGLSNGDYTWGGMWGEWYSKQRCAICSYKANRRWLFTSFISIVILGLYLSPSAVFHMVGKANNGSLLQIVLCGLVHINHIHYVVAELDFSLH